MQRLNIEIKASCRDGDAVRRVLLDRGADFRGADRQVDTYFRVAEGRLKLRQGDIENHLIHYRRPDQPGPKPAEVLLLATAPGSPLKAILTRALGVLTVVDKRREIYFLDNVKFHLDDVAGLGSFVEIEAQSAAGHPPADQLRAQCEQYLRLLGIRREDLLAGSYSDMLLARAAAGDRP